MPLGYDAYFHDFASGRRKNFKIGEKYEKDPEHMKWFAGTYPVKPNWPSVISTAKTGERIYMARLKHEGQLLPGYMRNGWACFAYKGEVIKTCEKHQLLYDGHVKWYLPHRVDENHVVVIGHDEDKNPLFLGRFFVNGTELFGEVRQGVCTIVGDPIKKIILSESERYAILGWSRETVEPDVE
ncbi:uncharacterized protein LOC135936984 [Cloeon dipterum]|uniref:uncharacterized protein LOC135936984 n=1 Tax=Cloeon dipterum TaxID=197152 RepID=UPI00322069F1